MPQFESFRVKEAQEPGKPPEGAREQEKPSQADVAEKKQLVRAAAEAITSGDEGKVVEAFTNAYKKYGGVKGAVGSFGEDSAQELEKKDITVRGAEDGTVLHKKGSEHALQISYSSNLDMEKGSQTTVKLQPYDWVTKKDSSMPSAEVIKGLAGPRDPANLMDTRELRSAWDEACQRKDFTQINKDLQAASLHALKKGGLDGLRAFESGLDQTPSRMVGGYPEGQDFANARELGKAWVDAYRKGDFKEINAQLKDAVLAAYREGGLPRVRQLEAALDKATPEVPGHFPFFDYDLEKDGALKISIRHGEQVPNDLVAQMYKYHITFPKNPHYGYVKDEFVGLGSGTELSVKLPK